VSVTPSLDDIAKKLQALNTRRPFCLTFRKAAPGQRKDSEYAVIFEHRSLGLQLANVVRVPQPALTRACAISRGNGSQCGAHICTRTSSCITYVHVAACVGLPRRRCRWRRELAGGCAASPTRRFPPPGPTRPVAARVLEPLVSS
jgi:hypothetical protein